MRNECRNQNNDSCRNESRKNLEFARELANVEERRDEKNCGGGCARKR